MEHTHLTWPRVLRLVYHSAEPGLWQLEEGPLVALEICDGCREGCPGLWEMAEAGEFSGALDFFELARKWSRYLADQRWRELEPLGTDFLRQALRQQEATYGMVDLLVEASHGQAPLDSGRALLLAEAAVEMAERLPVIDPEVDMDLQPEPVEAQDGEAKAAMLALAHAVRGNALRVRYQVWDAEKEFRKALEYLEEAEDDAYCELQSGARVLSMYGSLLTDTRRLEEALECLEEASDQVSLGDNRTLKIGIAINYSIALGLSNQDHEALQVLLPFRQEGLRAVPPRLELYFWNRLANQLVSCGRPQEARMLLPRIEGLASQAGVLDALRVRWLEARILVGEGDLPGALNAFLELHELFLREGAIHEAALLSLEIAATLHALDRAEETETYARHAVNLFVGLRLDRETLCALSLLAAAARRRKLTGELLSALMRYARGGTLPEPELWI
jgi:tetratricopeptide (TPR) repeat protein